MASGPIISWQIDGETVETDRFYFGGSKITADGDCSHEIKRLLLLGRKVMTNLDSINSSVFIFLYSPTLTSMYDHWKTIALTRWTFIGKVMSLLYNMLSRLVMGEGNGTPLQYSCLENPMGGGAW